jgi:nucleoside-diphosphate-sugar epimerase
MTPSKILVTGATGFIGSRLCERLALDHKLPYRALVRNFAHAARIARLGTEMVAGSFDDPPALERALAGCDTVVHLVDSEPSHTRTLVRASKRRGIRRFVHISSIAVHGPPFDQSCRTESEATIGRYPGEDYSNRKAAAERIVQQAINGGFPAIILRPTIVYGPYGPFVTRVITATRSSGVMTVLDEGSGICNAVYVDDVCDAIVAAMRTDNGVGEAFFVNADRAVTWREFNLTFATMVHADPPVVNVRGDDVRAYWAAQRPTRRTNGSAPRATASASTIPYPDLGRVTRECFRVEFSNRKARDVLRWSPRFDLQAGARATRTWLEFAGLVAPQRAEPREIAASNMLSLSEV